MKNNLLLLVLLLTSLNLSGQTFNFDNASNEQVIAYLNNRNVNSDAQTLYLIEDIFVIQTIAIDYAGEELYNVSKNIDLSHITTIKSSYDDDNEIAHLMFISEDKKAIERIAKGSSKIINNRKASFSIYESDERMIKHLLRYLKSFQD